MALENCGLLCFARFCIIYVGGRLTNFSTDFGIMRVDDRYVTEGDLRERCEEIEHAAELAYLAGADDVLLTRNVPRGRLVLKYDGEVCV